jgi:hypothetical protein
MPAMNCRACGSPSRETSVSQRHFALCEHCADQYSICTQCRRVTVRDAMSSSLTSAGTAICQNCDARNIILPHSAKPLLVPVGNWPHLGYELEVESDETYVNVARKVHSLVPNEYLITKSDGSLSYTGFEVCTRPASLDYHKTAIEPFFVAKSAGSLGYMVSYGSDNCGLHVHVSRLNLSQHSIALIVCFVNLVRNRRFIEVMANRCANRYTQMKNKRMQNAAWSTGDKYEAVNLNHPETLEFRIFKGTLRRSSFYKALEFCEALTLWAHSTYNTRIALSQTAFVRWVSTEPNKSRYRYLNAYIANRWYGKSSPLFTHDLWTLKNNCKPPPPPVEFNNDGRNS